MSTHRKRREAIEAWLRPYSDLEGLELYFALHRNHRYPRHAHDCYVVCVATRGSGQFLFRGGLHRPRPGQIIALHPDEVSDGETTTGPYLIRSFYIAPELFSEILGFDGRRWPTFPEAMIHDPKLAHALAVAHRQAGVRGESMETTTMLWNALRDLGARHARGTVSERPRRERAAVKRAREYLEENYRRKIGLTELAQVAGVCRDHLTRCFAADTGLAPFAYLDGVRVRRAAELLQTGCPLRDVAPLVGFYDQSHFTNRFRRIVGVTPGQYALARPAANERRRS